MLGTAGTTRTGRRLMAGWLALLLSLATLAPLAARTSEGSSRGMACCRNRGKCCCRKPAAGPGNSGPLAAAPGCVDCENVGVAATGASCQVPVRSRVGALARNAMGEARAAAPVPPSRIRSHSLWQRPPPSILPA